MPRASLILATRNRLGHLATTLASIRERGYGDVEIIVVDDGSTDGTWALLQSHRSWLLPVRIDREGGYRPCPGIVYNVGLALATADVLIQQSAEVSHLTDCVTPLVAACKPGVAVQATVYNGTTGQRETIKRSIGVYPRPEDVVTSAPLLGSVDLGQEIIDGQSIQVYSGASRLVPLLFLGAIHRQDWLALGGYKVSDSAPGCKTAVLIDDQELGQRMIARGMQFHFSGSAVAFHERHDKW